VLDASDWDRAWRVLKLPERTVHVAKDLICNENCISSTDREQPKLPAKQVDQVEENLEIVEKKYSWWVGILAAAGKAVLHAALAAQEFDGDSIKSNFETRKQTVTGMEPTAVSIDCNRDSNSKQEINENNSSDVDGMVAGSNPGDDVHFSVLNNHWQPEGDHLTNGVCSSFEHLLYGNDGSSINPEVLNNARENESLSTFSQTLPQQNMTTNLINGSNIAYTPFGAGIQNLGICKEGNRMDVGGSDRVTRSAGAIEEDKTKKAGCIDLRNEGGTAASQPKRLQPRPGAQKLASRQSSLPATRHGRDPQRDGSRPGGGISLDGYPAGSRLSGITGGLKVPKGNMECDVEEDKVVFDQSLPRSITMKRIFDEGEAIKRDPTRNSLAAVMKKHKTNAGDTNQPWESTEGNKHAAFNRSFPRSIAGTAIFTFGTLVYGDEGTIKRDPSRNTLTVVMKKRKTDRSLPRSITGTAIFTFGMLVEHGGELQSATAESTTFAEIVGMRFGSKKRIWGRRFAMEFLGMTEDHLKQLRKTRGVSIYDDKYCSVWKIDIETRSEWADLIDAG
jgi:hypothetical protein